MLDQNFYNLYTVEMNSIIISNACDLSLSLPLFSSRAACGFPSRAEDHIEASLDLNQYLIKHPAATFFVRAEGESMCDIGILDGDLLIVDRSLTPKNNSIVLVVIHNEFMVKRLQIKGKRGFLYPANRNFKPMAITDIEGFQFWGVVTYAIHDVCPG